MTQTAKNDPPETFNTFKPSQKSDTSIVAPTVLITSVKEPNGDVRVTMKHATDNTSNSTVDKYCRAFQDELHRVWPTYRDIHDTIREQKFADTSPSHLFVDGVLLHASNATQAQLRLDRGYSQVLPDKWDFDSDQEKTVTREMMPYLHSSEHLREDTRKREEFDDCYGLL
ncbi:MAG: hypothetical protein TREMPRED_005159 [Tremellales sp. Tagirdzhanova-0007]|nr:MAG: hypothetical protein TREMPRED_005159 [Tremellales sp. Tagirdzhanova-0007]